MAVQCTRSWPPPSSSAAVSVPDVKRSPQSMIHFTCCRRTLQLRVSALDRGGSDGSMSTNSGSNRKGPSPSSSSSVPNSNYVVPLDKSSCITRPLAEILRDLNKRIPDNIISSDPYQDQDIFIPWFVFHPSFRITSSLPA